MRSLIGRFTTSLITAAACVLFLPATGAAQHQHTAAHIDNIVEGNKNPELIPDSAAYRLYLLSVSVPSNSSEDDRRVQSAHIARIKLEASDQQAFLVVLAGFRSQYEGWVTRYNAAATAQGRSFDPAPFLQQREDLVQSTRDTLQRSLSAKGILRLDAHIQGEKRFMKVAAD